MRGNTDAWELVEKERRRDRMLWRLGIASWGATFAVLMLFAANTVQKMSIHARLAAVGAADRQVVYDAAMPLVMVVGMICLLVAVLATIGVFLRQRTASLVEIQLRLAALEEMLGGERGAAAGARADS